MLMLSRHIGEILILELPTGEHTEATHHFGRFLSWRKIMNSGLITLPAAALLGALVAMPAQAAPVTFLYTESFGAVPSNGIAPYATATFDDGGSPGTVTLTMQVAPTVGAADVTAMYFNLHPFLDPALLSFTRISGTGPTAGETDILTGYNEHRAGPDGFYDIQFDFPPFSGSQAAPFNAGEDLVYEISLPGLDAQTFNVFGSPGPGMGNPGPFLSVARFQDTFDGGRGWVGAVPVPASVGAVLVPDPVGAVPVPAAVWLFGSGLLGLIVLARRKNAV